MRCHTTRNLFAAAGLLAVMGCSGWATLQEGAQEAADVQDRALAAAIWVQCQAISVGAFDRRFGQWPEGAAAWRVLCRRPISEPPTRDLELILR